MKTLFALLARLLVFAAAVAVIVLSIKFFSGPENAWVCENGQWVAYGSPSQPKPEGECGDSLANALENQNQEAIPENKTFQKEGYIVLNSDNSWGFVYMEKETPQYELGSTILQLEPTSICFAPSSDIGQPCARVTWQPGTQASLLGEILKPGLTKVMQLRLTVPKEATKK